MEPIADHYQTLGVAFEATPSEIKKAYKRLAKVHHPGYLTESGACSHVLLQIGRLVGPRMTTALV